MLMKCPNCGQLTCVSCDVFCQNCGEEIDVDLSFFKNLNTEKIINKNLEEK